MALKLFALIQTTRWGQHIAAEVLTKDKEKAISLFHKEFNYLKIDQSKFGDFFVAELYTDPHLSNPDVVRTIQGVRGADAPSPFRQELEKQKEIASTQSRPYPHAESSPHPKPKPKVSYTLHTNKPSHSSPSKKGPTPPTPKKLVKPVPKRRK